MQNSMRQYCISIDVCLLLQLPQHFDYKHEEGIKNVNVVMCMKFSAVSLTELMQ